MKYKEHLKKKRNDPDWLEVAIKEFGQKEISGTKDNNPRVVEYLKSTASYLKKKSMISSVKDITDEISWCAAFMNWCMKQSGIKGTGTAWALDWKKWGNPISRPKRGCIAVFERRYKKDGKYIIAGHVGIYLGNSGDKILVLGGNQNNEVNITEFSTSKEYITNGKHRLIGYRALKEIETEKKEENKKSSSGKEKEGIKSSKNSGKKHEFSKKEGDQSSKNSGKKHEFSKKEGGQSSKNSGKKHEFSKKEGSQSSKNSGKKHGFSKK